MNEKANRIYCWLLSFGDTGQLFCPASSRYLAGISDWLNPCFGILYRHHIHQTPSRLEVV